jgi:DNA-binding NtrC family response regulator
MQERACVLVIDDEAQMGKLLSRLLGAEYDVFALTSAQAALDLIGAGERFDVILCGVMLPGVSGMDFYEVVGPIAPELVERIVFMSGGAFTARARAFIERADIRSMEKPFPSLAAFRARVEEHLARIAKTRGRP